MLSEGELFPNFELADQDDIAVLRKDILGAPVVIYFYPKDDTSGCTVEACEFRDEIPNFGDVRVIGVSPDAPKSHIKFIKKFGLNFTLLADVDHKLAESCGVWVEKSMYGKKYMGVERTTYLLDAAGVIVKIWRKVTPSGHAQVVRTEAERLQA